MVKELLFIPLFEMFIKETANGKRRKLNGERIKPQSIENYGYILKLVSEYESYTGTDLRVLVNIRNNNRLLVQERKYWKNFYRKFSDYLYYRKGYYDNFTGSVFKVIKAVFFYLKKEKGLPLPDLHECFYVREENIDIISLLPEQLSFLVQNKVFDASLSKRLRVYKDMFVFGCTTALRYSDLLNISVKDVTAQANGCFLHFKSVKTNTDVSVKLPAFACEIFNRYSAGKKPRQKLFKQIWLANFNYNLKKIGRLAGWTHPIGKYRCKNGEPNEIKNQSGNLFPFCDLLSSHVMRRTGITVLLMLEVPEYLVRKISGHTAASTSFFRYVNFAQSHINSEIDKAHQKLIALYMEERK